MTNAKHNANDRTAGIEGATWEYRLAMLPTDTPPGYYGQGFAPCAEGATWKDRLAV